MKVTKEQYEFALKRVDELLSLVSDVVIAYEKMHFPMKNVSGN
jgi:hypothetical protein